MSLSKKQREFAKAIGEVITYAYEQGYELTFGDAFRDPRMFGNFGEKKGYSASKSVHKIRLAVDLNLWVDGQYITTSDHPAWDDLHAKFELLGGAKRIPNDANHFSFEHWGVR